MRHKISVISGLGTVMLLLSLLSPILASADTASWSAEPIPGSIDMVLGPAGIDVRDLAVADDGATVYAVPGDSVPENVVYKSTDAGISWTTLSTSIEADLVAVAPDDEDMVAIASSSTTEVYLTINGGSTWYTLGTPQESSQAAAAAIYDIAISPENNGVHYIAAAGNEAGDIANVWHLKTGTAASVWKETNSRNGFSNANEVKAIAFSPNFPSDQVMVAISENSTTSVDLQIFSFYDDSWNDSVDFDSYPIAIVSDGGITGLTSASLSLDPAYLASDVNSRTAFIGLTVSGAASAASGIYRVMDDLQTALKTGTKIHSIAFDGTSLVAGDYDSNVVRRSTNPLATIPTVSTVSTNKGPGGENRVVVAMTGSKVMAGTSGNESAFATSGNDGATFNDISLIDTAITNARDVAVSADGGKIYLVTDDGMDLSLWCKVTTWQRILSQRGTTDYMVRISPEDADIIYLAKKNSTTIYYNGSAGEAEWYTRSCHINMQDLAVESDSVVYALNSTGSVCKTNNAAFTWGASTPTGLDSGATIVSTGADNLLISSQDGYVAYTTDGSTSWTRISEVLQSGAGKVQVTYDDNFSTNKIIYAASDTAGQDIKKWQIGTSTEWTDIFRNSVTGGIYGLTTDDGALYALEFNTSTGHSKLWQCLSPTKATSTTSDWSSGATTAYTDADDAEVHLNATPRALKASSDNLWAVKTNGVNKLYNFTDILIEIKEREPSSGFINPINPISGIAHDIGFSWLRPAEEATEYELQIALDEDFDIPVTTVTVESKESKVSVLVGPNQTGDARVNFTPGQTYYWRVRTSQPLYSLYSDAQSFTIESLMALVPGLLTPADGGTGASQKPSFSWNPVSGASKYRFVLGDNTELTPPIVDIEVKNAGFTMTEELDYGTTYFWKVRATEPIKSDWSILANFTVKEKPAEIISPPTGTPLTDTPSSTPVINMPEVKPPPPTIVKLSPPPETPTTNTDYLLVIIIIAALLLLAVTTTFIIKFTPDRPSRAAKGYGDRLENLKEALVNYLKHLKPPRIFRGTSSGTAKADEAGDSQPLSFAAASFLWMTTSREEEESASSLSADEEQAMGKALASRIQALARDKLLYQEFPQDAALFLYIWSHYGSRDETNRYLTKSFQVRRENVIEFLRCYLATPQESEAATTHKTEFDRTRYNSLATVIDPANVYEALTSLYGSEPDNPESMESGSPDRAIASQFARVHQTVQSETNTNKT